MTGIVRRVEKAREWRKVEGGGGGEEVGGCDGRVWMGWLEWGAAVGEGGKRGRRMQVSTSGGRCEGRAAAAAAWTLGTSRREETSPSAGLVGWTRA